ncbi:YjbF family lipoprotein [Sulfitobacter sp. W002]|mgnify:FL=1|uniref:YjbF family lipoprotein n=1 Tax=Sulfitobacter sp. W002 TaxID=2867024 RepID=UPI0021A30B8C|nr:YjbF family lipoprotein [Sulfitobacter sp. W002]UWR30208.1 YjbF family lipoprotein [Sulfitobacter sp. W002]
MKHFATGLLLIASLTLSACAGGGREEERSPLLSAGSTLFSILKDRTGPEAPAKGRVTVTRTLLDQTPGAVMQVVPENTGLQDFLKRVARRSDGTPGMVEVWQSTDQAQIVLREGVLVGTKGLGGDMRSAQAQTVIAALDGQGGGGERLITLARLDGTAQTVPFACDVTHLGPETIQIVDRRLSVRHFREDCVYGATTFSNDYWAEVGTGKLRRSRQWAGPQFGYMAIDLLKD